MIAAVERTCQVCDEDISHKQTGAKYCSESCRVSQYRPPKPARTWTCVDCGATGTQTGKGATRKRCEDCLNAPPPVLTRNCEGCGEPFTTTRPIQRKCRKGCRHGGFDSRARKITRQTGARYEPISRLTVLTTDNYVCHLCGTKTDPDSERCSTRYPSVDHVIPLSAGGDHTYDNVRCACFSCNARKRDRMATGDGRGGTSDGTFSTPRSQAENFLCELGGLD